GDFERVDEGFEPAAGADLRFSLALLFVVIGEQERGPAGQVLRRIVVLDPRVPYGFVKVVGQSLPRVVLPLAAEVGGGHGPPQIAGRGDVELDEWLIGEAKDHRVRGQIALQAGDEAAPRLLGAGRAAEAAAVAKKFRWRRNAGELASVDGDAVVGEANLVGRRQILAVDEQKSALGGCFLRA